MRGPLFIIVVRVRPEFYNTISPLQSVETKNFPNNFLLYINKSLELKTPV